jgi:hypothetical protein
VAVLRQDAAQRLLGAPALTGLAQLPRWRINIGAPGSGVPDLVRHLLDANRIEAASLTLLQLEQTPAVVALLGGELDALVFAAAPESLMVQMLLQTPGIGLYDFAQADAYSRRLAYLSAVTLPRGVVDLARDIPPNDVRLVAPTATLLTRRTTHPALIQLFVQAAQQIHGGAGWFQKKGEFPSALNTERPLAKGSPALLSKRAAAVAALPAVLARQPGRPHVAGAGDAGRGTDPAIADGAAALSVSACVHASSAGTASCAASRNRSAASRR